MGKLSNLRKIGQLVWANQMPVIQKAMQTNQSAQSPCDNAPNKFSLADGGSSAKFFGFLLLWILFCFGFFSGPFERKM